MFTYDDHVQVIQFRWYGVQLLPKPYNYCTHLSFQRAYNLTFKIEINKREMEEDLCFINLHVQSQFSYRLSSSVTVCWRPIGKSWFWMEIERRIIMQVFWQEVPGRKGSQTCSYNGRVFFPLAIGREPPTNIFPVLLTGCCSTTLPADIYLKSEAIPSSPRKHLSVLCLQLFSSQGAWDVPRCTRVQNYKLASVLIEPPLFVF